MASGTDNRLLSSLSVPALESILAQAVSCDLPLRMPLYDAEARPRYAYFITSGIASIVTTTVDGLTAEVGIIGREGMVGGVHLMGPAKVSTNCFIQLAGSGLRIRMTELRRLYIQSEEIRARIIEFQQEQTLIVSQIAGCNRLHEVESRLARWLLMARDQTGSDVLDFTQEFLGMMLGARRTTVSLVAGTLQRLGLLEFSRGKVKILQAEQMKEVACDCYPVVRDLHKNLYSKSTSVW